MTIRRTWVLSRGALTCECGTRISPNRWALLSYAGYRRTVRCVTCAAKLHMMPPDKPERERTA